MVATGGGIAVAQACVPADAGAVVLVTADVTSTVATSVRPPSSVTVSDTRIVPLVGASRLVEEPVSEVSAGVPGAVLEGRMAQL